MALHSGNTRLEFGTRGSARRFVRAACVGVIGLMAAAPAYAFENLTPAEDDALSVRRLQSDMMVAALSCQMREQYNMTVTRFESELVRHGVNLRGLFQRTYGARAEQELNSYVTRLANESSARRIAAGASYCESAAAQFTLLEMLPQKQLARFSAGDGISVASVPPEPRRPTREAGLPR